MYPNVVCMCRYFKDFLSKDIHGIKRDSQKILRFFY